MPSVASIDSVTGLVTGLSVGTTVISYTKVCTTTTPFIVKTPVNIIQLLYEKGLNYYMPENPKHFGYDNVMNPLAVAARVGHIGAIKYLIEQKLYNITETEYAARIALHYNQLDVLDILLQQNMVDTQYLPVLEKDPVKETIFGMK